MNTNKRTRHTSRPAAIISLLLLFVLSAHAQTTTTTNEYTENTNIIANPERGMMKSAQVYVGTPDFNDDNFLNTYTYSYTDSHSDATESKQRMKDYTSIIFLYCDLSDYATTDVIPDEYITLLQKRFDLMRNHSNTNLKAVVHLFYNTWRTRTYDTSREPDDTRKVAHINCLKDVLTKNADVIAAVDMGMKPTDVDWWTDATATATKKITRALLDAVPKTRKILVQSYGFYYNGVQQESSFTVEDRNRIGYFDYNFDYNATDNSFWGSSDYDKTQMTNLTRRVPVAGWLGSQPAADYGTWAEAETRLSNFHFSFFQPEWGSGVTAFADNFTTENKDTMLRNLGYRFVLTKCEYPQTAVAGKLMQLKMNIWNAGWAAPFNPRDIRIIMRNSSNEDYVLTPKGTNIDPMKWYGKQNTSVTANVIIPADLAAGDYKLFLALPDPQSTLAAKPGYSIRLASLYGGNDIWDATTGYNDLNATVSVTAGTETVPTGYNQTTFVANGNDIANPERGYYQHYELKSMDAELTPLNATDLASWRAENVTQVLTHYYLKKYRTSDAIDDDYINVIKTNMNLIRQAGMKCIVRFSYDKSDGSDTQSTEDDDPSLHEAAIDIVRKHIHQLKPILQENADIIEVLEAGFVGAWGEWSATNYTTAEKAEVIDSLLSIMPTDRQIAIRTPGYITDYIGNFYPLNAETAFGTDKQSRLAFHIDGMLNGSGMHGTFYTNPDRGTTEDSERGYTAAETQYVSCGGETDGVATGYTDNADKVVSELSKFHVSYLNRIYHADVIADWKTRSTGDEYSTLYNKVGMKLGYRLELQSVTAPQTACSGQTMIVTLKMKNTGWAAPFNQRDIEIVFEDDDNNIAARATVTNADVRKWYAQTTTHEIPLQFTTPDGLTTGSTYHLYLNLADKRLNTSEQNPLYAIRLASYHGTDDVWQPTTGFNNLYTTVTITATPPADGATTYYCGKKITSEDDLLSYVKQGKYFFIYNCAGDENHSGFVFANPYADENGNAALNISHDNRVAEGYYTTNKAYVFKISELWGNSGSSHAYKIQDLQSLATSNNGFFDYRGIYITDDWSYSNGTYVYLHPSAWPTINSNVTKSTDDGGTTLKDESTDNWKDAFIFYNSPTTGAAAWGGDVDGFVSSASTSAVDPFYIYLADDEVGELADEIYNNYTRTDGNVVYPNSFYDYTGDPIVGLFPSDKQDPYNTAYANWSGSPSNTEYRETIWKLAREFYASREPVRYNTFIRIRTADTSQGSLYLEDTNGYTATATADNIAMNTSGETSYYGIYFYRKQTTGNSTQRLVNYGNGMFLRGPGSPTSYPTDPAEIIKITNPGGNMLSAGKSGTPHWMTITDTVDARPGYAVLAWGYGGQTYQTYTKDGKLQTDPQDYAVYQATTDGIDTRNTDEGSTTDAHRFNIINLKTLPVYVGSTTHVGLFTPVPLTVPEEADAGTLTSVYMLKDVDLEGASTSQNGKVVWQKVDYGGSIPAKSFLYITATAQSNVNFTIDLDNLETSLPEANFFDNADVAATTIGAELATKDTADVRSDAMISNKTGEFYTLGYGGHERTDNNYKFYHFTGTYMPAFRLFVRMTKADYDSFTSNGTATAKGLTMVFDDNTATGIDDVQKIVAVDDNAPIYNISGQLILPAGNSLLERNALPRGLYIQNGRKFVVR